MFNGLSDMCIFDCGTVNVQRYRDEILEPHMRLFRDAVGPHFIFMDDNARSHRAHLLDDCLEREDIQHMDWPVMSLDMNPMGCLGCNRKMSCSPPASTEDTSTSPRCSLWGMGTAACRALEAPYREHATALLGMCSNHTAQHHHCYCGGNR